jgi:acyl-CoA synthetase (AMP-forming)/AMP-acid ligase II
MAPPRASTAGCGRATSAAETERVVIRFRGLLKPMFTRNGFNVYPAEVERVLEEDPRIERVRRLRPAGPAQGERDRPVS